MDKGPAQARPPVGGLIRDAQGGLEVVESWLNGISQDELAPNPLLLWACRFQILQSLEEITVASSVANQAGEEILGKQLFVRLRLIRNAVAHQPEALTPERIISARDEMFPQIKSTVGKYIGARYGSSISDNDAEYPNQIAYPDDEKSPYLEVANRNDRTEREDKVRESLDPSKGASAYRPVLMDRIDWISASLQSIRDVKALVSKVPDMNQEQLAQLNSALGYKLVEFVEFQERILQDIAIETDSPSIDLVGEEIRDDAPAAYSTLLRLRDYVAHRPFSSLDESDIDLLHAGAWPLAVEVVDQHADLVFSLHPELKEARAEWRQAIGAHDLDQETFPHELTVAMVGIFDAHDNVNKGGLSAYDAEAARMVLADRQMVLQNMLDGRSKSLEPTQHPQVVIEQML